MTTYFALAAALALIYYIVTRVTISAGEHPVPDIDHQGEHVFYGNLDKSGANGRSAADGNTIALRPMLGDDGTDDRRIPELTASPSPRVLGFESVPTWPYVDKMLRWLGDTATHWRQSFVDTLAALTAPPSRATASA